MGDYPHLGHRHADGVRIVRPLLHTLGPWDGADPPLAEVVGFRDQLLQLIQAEAGPLLLDLSGFEHARNWAWLVPVARECSGRGRRLAVWVSPAVDAQFAVTGFDRVVPVRTTFAEAMASLGGSPPAEPHAAADRGLISGS